MSNFRTRKVGIYGSMIDKLYYAQTLISLIKNEETNDYELEVLKDRWAVGDEKGFKTLEESIDILVNILIRLKFNDSNKMFQETVRLKLNETLKKILIENDATPSSETIEKYSKGEE